MRLARREKKRNLLKCAINWPSFLNHVAKYLFSDFISNEADFSFPDDIKRAIKFSSDIGLSICRMVALCSTARIVVLLTGYNKPRQYNECWPSRQNQAKLNTRILPAETD